MENYKRFLVFEFSYYYPSGGINDCNKSFDSLEEAKLYFDSIKTDDDSDYEIQLFDCQERILIIKK